MIDRRHYARLEANVFWRSAGLHAPRKPVVDMSLGGMLVYSDEAVTVGARLVLELLVPNEAMIELVARVVRVDVLPAGAPARWDVALEFLDVPVEARSQLARHLGVTLPEASESQPRVDEQQRHHVDDVEHEHGDERLLQPPARVPLAGGPDGNDDVREQNRDEKNLLHRPLPRSEAHGAVRRNANGAARDHDGAGPLPQTPDRLHVLFVTPYLPSPPRFGGQRRLHGLISGLAASHDVSVLSFVDPSEDQTEALRVTGSYCRRVATVPNRRYATGPTAKRLLQLGSLLSPRSYEWLIHREQAFESALDHMLAKDRYDVVHFEFPHMAAYRTRRSVAGASRPAFLLDEHNIEYDVVRQTARADVGTLRWAYSAINWRKVHAEERRAWAGLDGCTLTSARDQGMLLADAPETRTAVVPNGVDLDFFKPRADAEARDPDTLLFFGAIDYYPNTDGILFFLREVLPLLSSRVPRVKVSIVGRRPPASILARRSADVEITGAVDDVRPHIERAAVVIVPLRLGGGTRLKILEAMAMGKAVVSTSLGAEGLDVVPDRDLLVADDAAGFAVQIQRLLDDPELAARLGAAARRLVATRYGWEASIERLSAFYGEVIEARASA